MSPLPPWNFCTSIKSLLSLVFELSHLSASAHCRHASASVTIELLLCQIGAAEIPYLIFSQETLGVAILDRSKPCRWLWLSEFVLLLRWAGHRRKGITPVCKHRVGEEFQTCYQGFSFPDCKNWWKQITQSGGVGGEGKALSYRKWSPGMCWNSSSSLAHLYYLFTSLIPFHSTLGLGLLAVIDMQNSSNYLKLFPWLE